LNFDISVNYLIHVKILHCQAGHHKVVQNLIFSEELPALAIYDTLQVTTICIFEDKAETLLAIAENFD
jgi:hypothetical protein